MSLCVFDVTATEWKDFFEIGNNTGEIINKKAFDYENLKSLTLIINVVDCTDDKDWHHSCPDFTQKREDGFQDKMELIVDIKDANDNPPVFIEKQIPTGMERSIKPGTLLHLTLKAGNLYTKH